MNSMKKRNKVLVWICAIAYMVLLFVLLFSDKIFIRNGNKYELINHVNLEPFVEIKRYIRAIKNGSASFEVIMSNLVGNFVLFMPLVFFLTEASEKFRKWYVTLPIFAIGIAVIEYMQYYTKRGSCDIDDIILNVSGVFVAYIITVISRGFNKK